MTDTALLASITTAHLAIAFLRRHRTPGGSVANPFVLPSFVIASTPWLWSSPTGLVVTSAIHLGWLAVCEVCAPPVVRPVAPVKPVSTSTRPAANATRQVARPTATAPPAVAPATRTLGGFVSAPVLAVLDEATDIKTFRLARPVGLDFVAGQFVAVRVSANDKPHVRCYSISSSPDARGYLEISVRRQGMVSTLLHATLRTGSQLAIAQPAGQFVYPRGDDRPLALVAGGIGITPLLSMLRYAVSSDPTRPVTLLYSARDRQSLAFLSELRVVAERYPQVRIGITLSQDDSAPASWRQGHIDLPFVRQHVPHLTHTVFCICGPTPMMAAMEQMLLGEGVPRDQIRSEAFATAAAALSLNATTGSPETTAHGSSVGLPSSIPAEVSGSEYSITFAASGRQGPLLTSQTLLEAAEAEGVSIPSSCRAGVCQACRTRLVEGEADCRSSMLDADDRAAGFILPCVTWASSDCVLEA